MAKKKDKAPKADGVVVPISAPAIDESTVKRGEMIPIEACRIVTNARKNHAYDGMLAASLVTAGQLKPLMVFAAQDDKGQFYDVVGGGRRLVTMQRIRKDRPDLFEMVRADIYLNGMAALEASLHDNVQKEMHALDWYESMAKLMDEGLDEQEVAAHFGKPVHWVRRMAKLGNLAPEVRNAFRDGKIEEGAAIAFTLLPVDEQQKLLKRGVNQQWQIRQHVQQKFVLMEGTFNDNEEYDDDNRGSYAKFKLEDVPADKVNKSLFGDEVFVERDWFFERQNAWTTKRAEWLKQQGYAEVHILKPGDATTIQRMVKVGDAKKKDYPKLNCYLQVTTWGEVQEWRNMTTPKQASAVTKDAKGNKTTKAEKVVALKAADLTWAQQAMLGFMATMEARRLVSTGKVSEDFRQYLVVANQHHATTESFLRGPAGTNWGSGTIWDRFAKDYDGLLSKEMLELMNQLDSDRSKRKSLPFETWMKIPKKDRTEIYNVALSTMLTPAYNPGKALGKMVADLPIADWIVPGETFFNKYRSDQLMDYLTKSGVPESSGKWPIGRKKVDLVRLAVETAKGKADAYKFGLED